MKLSDYRKFQDANNKSQRLAKNPDKCPQSYSDLDPYLVQKGQVTGTQYRSRIEQIKREDDNIYVNIVIDHPNPGYVTSIAKPIPGQSGCTGPLGPTGVNFPTAIITGETPVNAEYNVTKNEPLLDKCSDYYCSVIRFEIPLDQIPLLICPIVPNQCLSDPNYDPDLTPLIIGIQYGIGPTHVFPVNLIYLNQNTNIIQAPPQNQPLQVITPYYFIFSYQNFLSMINIALKQAYVVSGLAFLFPNYLAPYFFLDPVTNLISLVTPSFFGFSTSPATSIPLIFMNAALATYLDAFNIYRVAYDDPQGVDQIFNITEPDGINPEKFYYPNGVTIPTPGGPTGAAPTQPFYLRLQQEYSALEYWASLRKIIVSTNLIPVKNEYLPATDNNFSFTNIDTSGMNVSFPILTDFIPIVDTSAGSSRSIAFYIPTSQYRLIDLKNDGPLQTIDVKLSWTDRDGNLYPIPISIFQQASIKLAFLRKELYKGASRLAKI